MDVLTTWISLKANQQAGTPQSLRSLRLGQKNTKESIRRWYRAAVVYIGALFYDLSRFSPRERGRFFALQRARRSPPSCETPFWRLGFDYAELTLL
jgi:hypothetical protein